MPVVGLIRVFVLLSSVGLRMQKRVDKPASAKGPVKPAAAASPPTTATQSLKTKPPLPPVDETGDLQPVNLGKASDEDLMRRTQQGDKQAFSLLYERYSSSVLSYLYRMLGNLEDVEIDRAGSLLPRLSLRPDLSLPAEVLDLAVHDHAQPGDQQQLAAASAARCAISPN